MEITEYYQQIFEKLTKGFQHSHYVLAYGSDLRLRDIQQGRPPRTENALPITVEPVEKLKELTTQWGLEVFIPIVGHQSQTVLSALDYEVYLENHHRLYADRLSQQHYFDHYIGPVTNYISNLLENHQIPYFLDLTPSGGHFLFWVKKGTPEWQALTNIGHLEDDLKTAYSYRDHADLKRNPPITESAALVYSGLGRLWEYVSRLAIRDVKTGAKELPLTLSDPENKSVNLDITQYADPAFMRIMRAPFSAHKKRARYIEGAKPLVDVPVWYYDTTKKIGEMDFGRILYCMWHPEEALIHAQQFTGYIPLANPNLITLIKEYQKSPLYQHHQEMDKSTLPERQEAFRKASSEHKLSEKTHQLLQHPNPRAMDPKSLVKLIDDLINNGWKPAHIGSLIADLYEQPEHQWNCDWFKYPSRTRGNFWARIYTGPTRI